MRQLIPQFISDAYSQHKFDGAFEAVVLFVDISGFTVLTENLLQHRRDGAELLSEALNATFSPLVHAVYERGGFISTFAGDAFTAVFPQDRENTLAQATLAAFFIQSFIREHASANTRYGAFSINVRIGMGMGSLSWGIIRRNDYNNYYFRGPAIDSCVKAASHAAPGQIFIAPEIGQRLADSVETLAVDDALQLTAHRLDAPLIPIELKTPTYETLSPFLLDSVFSLDVAAEFRDVVSVFITLREPRRRSAHNQTVLRDFVGHVMETAVSYGGYFNKLDFGDKGGVIVVIFGAPVTHENDLARAVDFLLALKAEEFTLAWRAGVTVGTAYAGFMGGEERSEYTVIGDTVNLAAHIMTTANWGDIWVSPETARRLIALGYHVEPAGEHPIKGKREPLSISSLVGRRTHKREQGYYHGPFLGRDGELTQLAEFIRPLYSGRFAGIMAIHGEAGMGKSRLVHELLKGSEQFSWLLCPADEILRHSLNPFKHFLREYFHQHPGLSDAVKKARFDDALDDLLDQLDERRDADPRAANLSEELDRTRSFLGALLDLHWDGSLYEQLEPQLRFENIQVALKSLILAESLRKPLIMHLEDALHLDDESIQLVDNLTSNVDDYAFGIIVTSRYRDDGTPFMLPLQEDMDMQVIDLNRLSKQGIRALAHEYLNAAISDTLLELLEAKTKGNPFFVEQLVLDLRERGILELDAKGAWHITQRQIGSVPTGVNAVLIARLDRLAAQVKAVVQTAAVLGQEFEVQILSKVLQSDTAVFQRVKQAEDEAIWLALSEIRYLFRHALLRDAAYDMQLRAHRRQLHHLAAKSIEDLYMTDLTPYYADLVHHYRQAANHEKERHYAALAGRHAVEQFANTEAVMYLSRALDLTPEEDTEGRYDLLFVRQSVHNVTGNRDVQAEDLDSLTELADQIDDDRKRAEVAAEYAEYLRVVGSLDEALEKASTALTFARAHDIADLEARVLRVRGMVVYVQRDFDTAQQDFMQVMELARVMGDLKLESRVMSNIGAITFFRGEYEATRNYLEQALEKAHESGDVLGQISILNNLGTITLRGFSDLNNAMDYFQRGNELARLYGFRRFEAITISNLGAAAESVGEYDRALSYSQHSLHMRREIQDRTGESAALSNISSALMHLGRYEEGLHAAQQAHDHVQKHPNPQGEILATINMAHNTLALGRIEEGERFSREAVDKASNGGHKTLLAESHYILGESLERQRQLVKAHENFKISAEIHTEIGEANLATRPLAGLARIALVEGDHTAALKHIDTILKQIDKKDENGLVPLLVYLSVHKILSQLDDSRASDVLESGYHLLRERSLKIEDESARYTFLNRIETHRELRDLWQTQNTKET